LRGRKKRSSWWSLARWKSPEESVVDALEFGARADQEDRGAIKELFKKVIRPKVKVEPLPFDEGLYKEIAEEVRRSLARCDRYAEAPEERQLTWWTR